MAPPLGFKSDSTNNFVKECHAPVWDLQPTAPPSFRGGLGVTLSYVTLHLRVMPVLMEGKRVELPTDSAAA